MQILNSNTVVVSSFSELREVLENDNLYNYVYFDGDILFEESFTINENKKSITIDGTYQDIDHIYIVDMVGESNVIYATSKLKNVTIKNLEVTSCNIYGIISFPASSECNDSVLEYINVKYDGVQLGYNPQGKVRILDSIITLEETDGVAAQEVAEASFVEIGGNVTITNSSNSYSAFNFAGGVIDSYFKILPYSKVSITSKNKEFMRGTTNLDFKVMHDAELNLITNNGFGSTSFQGANNVLIDERATFSFIENGHQRVPMWNIYGTLTINEGANFYVINTYVDTPTDNYNIHFRGENCKLILNKPNSVILYTPNANAIYTNNEMDFTLKVNRINKWTTSTEFTSAGDINNLPDFSWYKDDDYVEITGTFTSTDTNIDTHNFTEEDLKSLPLLTDFMFQNSRQFSIGLGKMNIHPVDNTSNALTGHTLAFADVLVKYDQKEEFVVADENGRFELTLADNIPDNTTIQIISCVAGTFIYTTREITVPHTGELSIIEEVNHIVFDLSLVAGMEKMLPKKAETVIRVVDSRLDGSEWKMYVKLAKPMTSENGFELVNAIVFKDFNDNISVVNDLPILVFTGENNGGNVLVSKVTWSTEKGILLDLENNALEVNEEYMASLLWNIEE